MGNFVHNVGVGHFACNDDGGIGRAELFSSGDGGGDLVKWVVSV